MTKTNLIDLSKYKKEKKVTKTEKAAGNNHTAQVLSFADKLEQRVQADRRKAARTVLSRFIGVFVVTSKNILHPVWIHDISTQGCAFDSIRDVGSYNEGQTVTVRVYMSHDTFFSFSAKVTHKRLLKDKDIYRHGVIFQQAQPEALYHFVKFLETVSQVAQKDKGEKVAGRVD